MRQIKTILELLIGKSLGDHKSVSTLGKYLKMGFSKIAHDELSIDKSNRTQIKLIKAVLGMHHAYDKLDNFAKYSNFTRKELISELKKLKAFEGNLKHAVIHMMIHSHRMDAKMKQIKSAIEEKAVSHIICTLFDVHVIINLILILFLIKHNTLIKLGISKHNHTGSLINEHVLREGLLDPLSSALKMQDKGNN